MISMIICPSQFVLFGVIYLAVQYLFNPAFIKRGNYVRERLMEMVTSFFDNKILHWFTSVAVS